MLTSLQNRKIENFGFYPVLLSLSITFFLAANVLVYRLISVPFGVFTGGTFLLPFTYLIYDIITEVYGYQIGRKTIWYVLFCNIVFIILALLVINLPAPSSWRLDTDYTVVFSPLLRLLLSSTVGMLLGSFVNIYLISKWKMLVKGKYLWLRILGASAIGEAVLSFVGFELALAGVLPSKELFTVMLFAWIYKAIFTIIGSYPATMLAIFIRNKEGWEVDDLNKTFNPFE